MKRPKFGHRFPAPRFKRVTFSTVEFENPVAPTTIAPEAGDTESVAVAPTSTAVDVDVGPMLPRGLATAETVCRLGPSEPLQAASMRGMN